MMFRAYGARPEDIKRLKSDSDEVKQFLRRVFEGRKPILMYRYDGKAICGFVVELESDVGRMLIDNRPELIPETALNPDPLPRGRQVVHIREIGAILKMDDSGDRS